MRTVLIVALFLSPMIGASACSDSNERDDAQAMADHAVLRPADLGEGWKRGPKEPLNGGTWYGDSIKACLSEDGLRPLASAHINESHDLDAGLAESVESFSAVMRSTRHAADAFQWTTGPKLAQCLRANEETGIGLFEGRSVLDVKASASRLRGTSARAASITLQWRIRDERGESSFDMLVIVATHDKVLALAMLFGASQATTDQIATELTERVTEDIET